MSFAFWWLIIIEFLLVLYILLDGADLGVGILNFAEPDPKYRSEMLAVVATVWDGNETWLILAAVALFGGFPLAYATLLPALYVPLILMLFAIITRGISFEVNAQNKGYQRISGYLFATGSLLAAFAQGVILGAYLQGIPVTGTTFSGGAFAFLTPYSLLTGLLLTCVYTVLAASWLQTKGASKASRARVGRRGQVTAYAAAILLALTVFFTTRQPLGTAAWRDLLLWSTLAVSGGALLLTAWLLRRIGVGRGSKNAPYIGSLAALLVMVLGLLGSVYPDIVPGAFTFEAAASPTKTQNFLMYGVGLSIPIVLIYNVFTHRVFRNPDSPAQPKNQDKEQPEQRSVTGVQEVNQ